MPGSRLSVVDCETTGLGRHDRVIEVAVVTLDHDSGDVVDEFETLINPGRDVGPTHLHGITAKMVGLAPRFEEVAPALASRLHQSTIVAHNLRFDTRMLEQEYRRLRVSVAWGAGICTLQRTGMKLSHAARSLGISLENHHRAIDDARVAAKVLRQIGWSECDSPCVMSPMDLVESCRTLRRDAFESSTSVPLRRWLQVACVPSSVDACVEYFDLLDHVLADLVLEAHEQDALSELRESLGLRQTQIHAMHMAYFESLRFAALSDGVLTENEHRLLVRIASWLGIPRSEVPDVDDRSARPPVVIERGTRICFTGSAVDSTGNPLSREALEMTAATHGCQPVSSVTKKGCDLLVAADPSSQSLKAAQAKRYGIPIVSVADYLRLSQAAM